MTILITGAGRGIGRQMAMSFAKKGWNVAVNYYKSEEQAKSLVREITANGGRAQAFFANVADRQQVQDMAEQVQAEFGGIDALINNAGIAQQTLFTDLTEQQWDEMFAVNVKGVFHCCQSVLPHMLEKQSGKIINISSVWGLVGASCEVHYSAAKAAIIGFTKALAKELGPSGIQVNCIAPGVVDTQMNGDLDDDTWQELKEQTPLGRIGTARDIARLALFLAGDGGDFITGQVISPNGGFVI